MSVMQNHMSFIFWNRKHRLYREGSLHDTIRSKRYTLTPGCMGDASNRGQPGRFDKWNKLPDAAKRLYWRVRKNVK